MLSHNKSEQGGLLKNEKDETQFRMKRLHSDVMATKRAACIMRSGMLGLTSHVKNVMRCERDRLRL